MNEDWDFLFIYHALHNLDLYDVVVIMYAYSNFRKMIQKWIACLVLINCIFLWRNVRSILQGTSKKKENVSKFMKTLIYIYRDTHTHTQTHTKEKRRGS